MSSQFRPTTYNIAFSTSNKSHLGLPTRQKMNSQPLWNPFNTTFSTSSRLLCDSQKAENEWEWPGEILKYSFLNIILAVLYKRIWGIPRGRKCVFWKDVPVNDRFLDLKRVAFWVGQLKKISSQYVGLLKRRLFNIVLVAFSSDQEENMCRKHFKSLSRLRQCCILFPSGSGKLVLGHATPWSKALSARA
jgi:hypothetical protein